MLYKINVTKENFHNIDSTESKLFFYCPPKLPQTITLKLWGLRLIYSIHNQKLPELLNLPYKDTYVSGIASVTIKDVLGGMFRVFPYNNIDGQGFINLSSEEKNIFERKWNYNEDLNGYEYFFEGCLDWPFGFYELEIIANGECSIEFDTNDCIDFKEYVVNTKKYGFDPKKLKEII